jgi:GTPase SAR1 family protein
VANLTLSGQVMDSWRIAVLGDGGVGKTALAVQVSYFFSDM